MQMLNRHVWVDTDLDGQVVIDLEDWLNDGRWDNAVEHLTACDVATTSAIIVAWINWANSIEDCRNLGGKSSLSIVVF